MAFVNNQVNFYRPDLGSLCHFRNSGVPVAVLTDLKGNIIFSNNLEDPFKLNNQWAVSGWKTLVTRFWAASTAYVNLVANVSLNNPPTFPHNKAGVEREVCLWVGYLDSIRPVAVTDLGTRLLRVFVGIVDTVTAVLSGNGGYTCSISMRDRMKWLMDTEVTFNPASYESLGERPLRSNLIYEVVQRGVGQVESEEKSCAACGKKIQWQQTFNYDLGDPNSLKKQGANPTLKDGTQKSEVTSSVADIPASDDWYKNDGPLSSKTTTTQLSVEENPYLRVFTTRAPIDIKNSGNFLIAQQVPLNVLRSMAQQEIYPTEVFQDNRDGNIYYCPRANDASGLKDPKRYYRTYFAGLYPQTMSVGAVPPDINQMLLGFKEEHSSIGMKTNFWVTKNAPLSQGGTQDDWSIHLQVKPKVLNNINYACKFFRVHDDTITSAEEAAVVALNAARVMAKDTRVGTAILLGDPSLVPGEVIQVIGSVLQPNLGLDVADSDRILFEEFNNAYNENIKEYGVKAIKDAGASAPAISGAEVTLPVYDGSTATIKIDKIEQQNQDNLICDAASQVNGGKSDPATIFRIDAVMHKCNIGTTGFQTELALTIPF